MYEVYMGFLMDIECVLQDHLSALESSQSCHHLPYIITTNVI